MSFRLSTYEVYRMDSDGSDEENITIAPGLPDMTPAWNNTGDKVFFQRSQNANAQSDIYMLERSPNGQFDAEPVQITNTDTASEFSPVVSPDGTKLAFISNRDGNLDIHCWLRPCFSGYAGCYLLREFGARRC